MVFFSEVGLRIIHFELKEVNPNTLSVNLRDAKDLAIIATPDDKSKYSIGRTQVLKKNKDANEFRVFIFGGSNVELLKDTSSLRDLLHEVLPGHKINIVNLGLASVGTERIKHFVAQSMQFNPDLILLYTGHNEFTETMADLISGRFFNLSYLVATITYHSRTAQLIKYSLLKLSYFLARKSVTTNSFKIDRRILKTGIFQPDKKFVLKKYEKNLQEIISIAKKNSVPIIIGTVAYNRETLLQQGLDSDELLRAQKAFQQSNFALTRELVDQDNGNSEFPFQASIKTNQIVKNLAAENKLILANIDHAIIEKSKNKLPGSDLFIDHCHLNDQGKLVLFKTFANAFKKLYPPSH